MFRTKFHVSKLLLLVLVSASVVQQRASGMTRGFQGDEPVSPNAGLLGYGWSVHASQLPNPLSSAIIWALHAVQSWKGPREYLCQDAPAAEAVQGRCRRHATYGWSWFGGKFRLQRQAETERGTGPFLSSAGSRGSGATVFMELYGDGDGFGDVTTSPVGACYDELMDGPVGVDKSRGRWREGRREAGADGDGSAVRSHAAQVAGEGSSLKAPSLPTLRPHIIYIPPLTGTELQAKLNDKSSVPRWWCSRRTSSWFRLWATLESLLPWEFPCFADNLRLVPGSAGGGARPPAGVEVRVGPTLEPAQGDPWAGGGLQPWSSLVRGLRHRGWTNDLLDTHAYDWRLSPVEWSRTSGSFHQLRDLITERVAASGGRRRVVLVGLSLGASYAATFLSSPWVDATWKEAHVERLVTMSGRLEGLEAVLDRDASRQLMRGLPALAWIFPVQQQTEEGGSGGLQMGEGLVEGRAIVRNTALGREYTAEQLGQALRDAGATETAAFWETSRPFATLQPPNVSTHCFYSYGLQCAARLTYNTPDFSDAQPAVQYEDGDVTVPHASLAACRSWAVRQVAPVRSYSYFGVVHGMLTAVPEALEDILAAVAGEPE